MEFTLKANSKKTTTDKYLLLQSEDEGTLVIYKEVFSKTEGSFSTVSDNDAITKFNVASAQFDPTVEQMETMNKLATSFKKIESEIDPTRLNFYISKATDNEICINRESDTGISKIIIHEDGIIGLSFIAFINSNKKNNLEFYETDADFESLTYKFFS